MGRSYSDKDLKILWGAHAMCSHPRCRVWLIVPATDADPQAVIGKICHIVAHSNDGPRADPSFPEDRREDPENLILLCGTHHDMVDVQDNSHTIAELHQWKRDHEAWVRTTLSDAVLALTFAELEQMAAGLASSPPSADQSLAPPTPPLRKMQHNLLTSQVAQYYQIGQLRFADIETYLANTQDWDDSFADRLIGGFQTHYDLLWDRGLRGDDLYLSLADWASGGPLATFPRTAAGVSILSFLFHTCDIFERALDLDPAV
jgi:hypothetical protein